MRHESLDQPLHIDPDFRRAHLRLFSDDPCDVCAGFRRLSGGSGVDVGATMPFHTRRLALVRASRSARDPDRRDRRGGAARKLWPWTESHFLADYLPGFTAGFVDSSEHVSTCWNALPGNAFEFTSLYGICILAGGHRTYCAITPDENKKIVS